MIKVTIDQVYDAYRANPYASQQEIADLFGVSRELIRKKLKKLELLGLVRLNRKWRSVEAFAVPRVVVEK